MSTPGDHAASFIDDTSASPSSVVSFRDYGGTGRPVVLIHGAGADRTSWDTVGPLLAARYRTVAVDMPGHGRSADAEWTWDAAVDAVDAMVTDLHWHRPAVVGHSVGGLVAGRWAQRHRDCPCAVSLDGHQPQAVQARHHDTTGGGLDAGRLDDLMRRYRDWFDALFAEHEATLTPWQSRASALARAAMSADDLASFSGIDVPLLVVVAERSGPGTPPEFEPLMAAFRAGLLRDLEALAAHQPGTAVRTLASHHGMISEAPREVAALLDDFIAANP